MSLFCVVYPLLGWPPSSVTCTSSETLMEKTNFSFPGGYQLEVVFMLEWGLVATSLSEMIFHSPQTCGHPMYADTISVFTNFLRFCVTGRHNIGLVIQTLWCLQSFCLISFRDTWAPRVEVKLIHPISDWVFEGFSVSAYCPVVGVYSFPFTSG